MICPRCNSREITGKRSKYCNLCRAADPHRHHHRLKKEIIVKIDCESVDGQIITMSYGREDGSSASIWTQDPREAMLWLTRELTGEYNGMKQIYGAFHFNHDMAILSKNFDPADMQLVHKATYRKGGLICATQHTGEHGRPCGKLHRFNPKDIAAVITDGGEGQVIAWDQKSCLAIAATPRRRFYIEYRPAGDLFAARRIIDIHDNGSAFVGGLENVIDTWQPELTPEQKNIIAWGKKNRHDGFLDGTPANIMAYSEAECIADARCTRKLLDTISQYAGIPIRANSLYGSGSVAGQAYNYHKVATRKESHQDAEAFTLARLCYFGGLIEDPVVGIIDIITNEEDINSAYPFAMQSLPCMLAGHGHWSNKKKDVKKGSLGYVHIDLWGPDRPVGSTPPFIVRHKSGNVYQTKSACNIWMTIPEYQAAVKRFDFIPTDKTKVWVQTCNCPNQFAWMVELYHKRQEIKAQMKLLDRGSPEWHALNVQQEAIKLVLNSCYGKLAQQRPTLGKYTNLHFAAFITGFTRAKVRERSWYQEDNGGTIVYQHTDSVLFVGGNPKDEGNALGAFGLEKASKKFLVIQPGLAIALEGGKTASRGCQEALFKKEATEWAQRVDFTSHPSTWPELHLPRKMMISRRMALHWGKPDLAGCFMPQPLDVGIKDGKRNVRDSRQMPGHPTAWILDPLNCIHPDDMATEESLNEYMSMIDRQIKEGEWDDEVWY